jgi:hypothetical protein
VSFTILTGKELASAPRPLLMVDITDADNNVRRFATQAVAYAGNAYSDRLTAQNIDAIQALSSQGFDSIPSLTLEIADPDAFIWTNYIIPHRWKGGKLLITFVLWDASSAATGFSTDSYQWTFIAGNPSHEEGTIRVQGTSKMNFSRIKVPTVAIERRCPWIFPATAAQRQDGADNKISPYYQCGYSPDATGANAVGTYQSGTTPFATCDLTRESCTARGMFSADSSSRATLRFAGITWSPPTTYGGKKYTSGAQTFGYNAFNDARYNGVHNLGYGKQWVNAKVMVPAADPNSLRFEASVCLAAYGAIGIYKVLVNGDEIPFDNSRDRLFTWYYVNPGGRTGHITTDAIFNGQGDPYGSIASIECVVPSELAQAGSLPTCRVLLEFSAIEVPTQTTGDFGLVPQVTYNPVWHLLDLLTWCDYQYTDCDIQTFMDAAVFCGLSGVCSVSGSTVTIASGRNSATGNYDNFSPAMAGKKIVISGVTYLILTVPDALNITVTGTPTAGDWAINNISYQALNGATKTHERYRGSWALEDRKPASQIITALRNASNLLLSPNSKTGKMQCFVKQSMAEQQPAAIAGSNYNTAISSRLADGTTANGYAAYSFSESNIEGALKVTTRNLEDTPNKVQFQFQDEDNQWQDDSISQIDPQAYTAAGLQELPLQFDALGVPNFDQASRIANIALAEVNRGNPRGDAGGSLIFTFRTSMKAVHLASRIGLICILSWAQLGLSQQPVRVISAKPSSDGKFWDITAHWHEDIWYTDAYGQNPAPFYKAPYSASVLGNSPLPWKPCYEAYDQTDALYPAIDNGTQAQANFRVTTSTQTNQDGSATPILGVSGYVPVSKLSDLTGAPFVPLQAQAASTGGQLSTGTYYMVLCAIDYTGALSGPSQIVTGVIPASVTTGLLTIPNIIWDANVIGYRVFIGTSVLTMYGGGDGGLGLGNPASVSVGYRISANYGGVPDVNYSRMLIRARRHMLAGAFEGALSAVNVGASTFTFSGAAWTVNQWAGRVISFFGTTVAGRQFGDSYTIASNTATVLTVTTSPRASIAVGDWAVIRTETSSATSTTITDSALAMPTNAHVGEQVVIIAGTGAGQPPLNIAANTGTAITLAQPWYQTPDSTSVWVILEPTFPYQFETSPQQNQFLATLKTLASIPLDNYAGQNLFVQAITEDAAGNQSVGAYAPFREIHIFGQAGAAGSPIVGAAY